MMSLPHPTFKNLIPFTKVESGAQCIQIFEFGQPGSFLLETNWDGNWNAAPGGIWGCKTEPINAYNPKWSNSCGSSWDINMFLIAFTHPWCVKTESVWCSKSDGWNIQIDWPIFAVNSQNCIFWAKKWSQMSSDHFTMPLCLVLTVFFNQRQDEILPTPLPYTVEWWWFVGFFFWNLVNLAVLKKETGRWDMHPVMIVSVKLY